MEGMFDPTNLCIQSHERRAGMQSQLTAVPLNPNLILEEKEAMEVYYNLASREEESIRLKSRATWLKCGDKNNKLFYIMQRVCTSTVYSGYQIHKWELYIGAD